MTACADRYVVPEVRVEKVEIPAELMSCAAEPPPPSRAGTIGEFGAWVADLRAAGQDCRAKVDAIREIHEKRE